jgi:ankyrin repeat protein
MACQYTASIFKAPLAHDSTRFLLACLYVDSLVGKNTKTKVKSALQKFSRNNNKEPKKLYDDVYNEALQRIEDQQLDNKKTAKKALSWITYAERQLTTRELRHALAVELGELDEDNISNSEDIATICAGLVAEKLDKDNIPDVEDIVSVCAGLVTVDEKSNIIRLVHYTTQEYFERIREKWFPYAQLRIASTCLTYLSFSPFRSGSCPSDDEFKSRLGENVFLDYASRYWGQHAQTVQEPVSELASSFLQDTYLVSSAVQAMSISSYQVSNYSQRFPKGTTGLHLTAIFGLLHLSDVLLSQSEGNISISANAKDNSGRTPLLWAAEKGHEAVVKLLLETGEVDVDSKDTAAGRTPLSWAAREGHEAVVKLLLETGKIDVDSKDTYSGRTPLSWAAGKGHEAVVKLLLETGKVDVDLKDTAAGQTPLSWAAEKGHEAVVKLLLETGKIDVDSKDTYYDRTPLSWAARKGHEAVVKLLLETGKIDVDSKDTYSGRTPLSWAAEKGHEAVVKLLLETGEVDVDSKDTYYDRTPLSWAAGKGHEAVVKLLLETGKVDVDSKDTEYGQTPLSWAAGEGHEAVVKLLLETGEIDVDSKDKAAGRTPLSWAAEKGHEAVVKLLLETGKVDVDSKDTYYGRTPLSWAAEKGHEAVVKLLQLSTK